MMTTSHYREAEGALKRAQHGSRASAADLAAAQLHAMLAVADELRSIHNELISVRELISQPPDGLAARNI
jgi:hypothetical protein